MPTEWDSLAWGQSLAAVTTAWALRHPDARRVTQELAIRIDAEARRIRSRRGDDSQAVAMGVSVAQLLDTHAKTNLLPDERGGSARAACRPGRFSPIERLVMQKYLRDEHQRAARSLESLVTKMTAATNAKAGQLEAGHAPSVTMLPAMIAEEWSIRYVPWSREQLDLQASGRRHLGLTLAVCVWGEGFRESCARRGIGRHRGYDLLAWSLDDWIGWTKHDSASAWTIRAHEMARGKAAFHRLRKATAAMAAWAISATATGRV